MVGSGTGTYEIHKRPEVGETESDEDNRPEDGRTDHETLPAEGVGDFEEVLEELGHGGKDDDNCCHNMDRYHRIHLKTIRETEED